MEGVAAGATADAGRVGFGAAVDGGFDAGEGLEVAQVLRWWGEGVGQGRCRVRVVWVWAEGGEEGWEGGAVGLVRRGGHLRCCERCLWRLNLGWEERGKLGEGMTCMGRRTGVRSLLSSSVADAAASMRSSHRLPKRAAADCGSADMALRS